MAIDAIGEPTAKKIISARPIEGFETVEEFCRLTKVSGSGPFLNGGDKDVGVVGKLFASGAMDSLEGL
jgi:hypothetical protein